MEVSDQPLSESDRNQDVVHAASPLLSHPTSVVGTPLTKQKPAFDLHTRAHISRKMLLTLGEVGGTWWDLRAMSVSWSTQGSVPSQWGERPAQIQLHWPWGRR